MIMVPVSSIVTMALGALFGIAAPVLLAVWLVKKYKVRPTTILIGAGVFIVFALVLEPILHQVVLKGPHGPAILGDTWYYALYGGLAAGIFEETGRFLAMKFLLKKEPSTALPAVAYGAGHGGVEMLLLYGVTMVSSIALAVMINSGQADTILAAAPAEAQAQVQAQFDQLQDADAGSYLYGIWERISALILQLALSVIVWTAVRKGGKWLWLFPAAILLHFLVDALAVVLTKSVGLAAVEAVIFAMAIAIGAIGYMLARKL
jgi:Predicted membrane protein